MDSVIVFLLAAYLNISADSAKFHHRKGWYLPDTTHLFSTAWIEHQAHVLSKREPTYKREKKFPLFYGSFDSYSLPCNGIKTSGFGRRWTKYHYGIDLGGQNGDPIYSSFDGIVRYAQYNTGGYGHLIVIRHFNGLETYYAHLSEINVKPGTRIKTGEIIGKMGSTGHSTGDHLHFEVRILGYPINPEFLFSFSEKRLLANVYEIGNSGVLLKNIQSPFCQYPVYIYPKNDSHVRTEKMGHPDLSVGKDSLIESPRNKKIFGNMTN